MARRRLRWGAALAALSIACALSLGSAGAAPKAAPSGEVTCAGADTMRGLVSVWGALAQARAPALVVRQKLDGKLAADGFAALVSGQANCATFVREPFPSEVAAFTAKFGYAPTLINVAGGSYATQGGTHAIAVYVNAANPLRRLDLSQLDAALSADRRRGGKPVMTWGDLGLRGAWAGRPAHIYGMTPARSTGNPPGVVNFMVQRVLLGGRFREDLRVQVDKPGESALQAIVNRVSEDPEGLGYSGFGYARPGVHTLALAETAAGPFYRGTAQDVQARRYPLSRRIYILVNRKPGEPLAPALSTFLRSALSREGQAALNANPEHFLPLTPADLAVARASLN